MLPLYIFIPDPFPIQVLAYEAGRKGKIRVNTISAGNFFSFAKKVNKFLFRKSCRTETVLQIDMFIHNICDLQ